MKNSCADISPRLKLWQTTADLDSAVEAYTVGDDPRRDAELLEFEVYGSLAHAEGLKSIGLLSDRELADVRDTLSDLMAQRQYFTVTAAQEDVHTAVEQFLTTALGETGAKIHAGRSRNDQVQVDLRLWLKDRLLELQELCCQACQAWESFGRHHDQDLMPGYTHLQRAMPTTVGHWAASHAEAFLENLSSLRSAFDQADSCPLGSAAGFGSGLALPRPAVARLLGFSRVQRNTLRVQSSRPRLEAAALSALALLARDIATLAWDISLFSTTEFGFMRLGEDFTTGSSIMPHKRNPDVAELTRGRAALFSGWLAQVLALGALPSGYHRDYQLSKGPLMDAFAAARAMLGMACRLAKALSVDRARCGAVVTPDMLSTQAALSLVRQGVPFRQAYRSVAQAARAGQSLGPIKPELPDSPGAPGNPDWPAINRERRQQVQRIRRERERLHSAWKSLLKGKVALLRAKR
ncbi:MAG TPA: argininosuccinate lyase [Elusimicrobia bacterium]|nr:argininosuccinate lyase [Elusimicrobiota bacterium]HBT61098.1 argininosuccinate lyase [Elusimicrobiota bacterium]